MKYINLALVTSLIFGLTSAAYGASYELDTAHTNVQFGVRHLGINTVRGNFGKFKGTIDYDPAHPEAIKVEAEIDAGSLVTGNTKRDDHVKSKDFLDVSRFPKITFVSKSAKSTGKDSLQVNGILTILNHSNPITLTVTDITGPGTNPLDKKAHIGAEVTAQLIRQDYGITWNGDGLTGFAGEAAIGNEIKLQFDVDAVQN